MTEGVEGSNSIRNYWPQAGLLGASATLACGADSSRAAKMQVASCKNAVFVTLK